MKKLNKYLKKDETITLAELYRRVYGHSGTYLAYQIFDRCIVQEDTSIIILYATKNRPMMIQRRTTFFEKVLDKLK